MLGKWWWWMCSNEYITSWANYFFFHLLSPTGMTKAHWSFKSKGIQPGAGCISLSLTSSSFIWVSFFTLMLELSPSLVRLSSPQLKLSVFDEDASVETDMTPKTLLFLKVDWWLTWGSPIGDLTLTNCLVKSCLQIFIVTHKTTQGKTNSHKINDLKLKIKT